MRFEKLCCVLLASSGFLFQPASAQDAGPLKIGYVDINTLVAKSPQWEAGNKRLEQEFAARKKAIREKELALGQLQERVQKEGRTMNTDELRKLEDQMVTQDRQIRWEKGTLEDDYKRQHGRMMADLEKEISKTIGAFIKQEGYDLILTEGVLLPSSRVNLTERVLTELKNSAAAKKK